MVPLWVRCRWCDAVLRFLDHKRTKLNEKVLPETACLATLGETMWPWTTQNILYVFSWEHFWALNQLRRCKRAIQTEAFNILEARNVQHSGFLWWVCINTDTKTEDKLFPNLQRKWTRAWTFFVWKHKNFSLQGGNVCRCYAFASTADCIVVDALF